MSDLPTEPGSVVRAHFRGHSPVDSWVRTCDGKWKTSDLGSLRYRDEDLDLVEVVWPRLGSGVVEYRVERKLRGDADTEWRPSGLGTTWDNYAAADTYAFSLKMTFPQCDVRIVSAPVQVWTPCDGPS